MEVMQGLTKLFKAVFFALLEIGAYTFVCFVFIIFQCDEPTIEKFGYDIIYFTAIALGLIFSGILNTIIKHYDYLDLPR